MESELSRSRASGASPGEKFDVADEGRRRIAFSVLAALGGAVALTGCDVPDQDPESESFAHDRSLDDVQQALSGSTICWVDTPLDEWSHDLAEVRLNQRARWC